MDAIAQLVGLGSAAGAVADLQQLGGSHHLIEVHPGFETDGAAEVQGAKAGGVVAAIEAQAAARGQGALGQPEGVFEAVEIAEGPCGALDRRSSQRAGGGQQDGLGIVLPGGGHR
ncbi:MAG: hypothetical protein ACK559_01695, partial [bacterium]